MKTIIPLPLPWVKETADKSTEASLRWRFLLFPADSLNGWKASGD